MKVCTGPGRILGAILLSATGLLMASCSTYEVARVVTSGDPEAAVASLARARATRYRQNPLSLVQDIRRARAQFEKLVALLRGEVSRTWGEEEVVTPSNHRYVKYTHNYKSRAVVHFDRGLVTVETLDQTAPQKRLRSAIVTTLLTPDDPRSVDLYSDREVRLKGRPYLAGLVNDQDGRPVEGPAGAEGYADYLVRERIQHRTVQTPQGAREARYVRFRLVNDYLDRQARRYEPLVERNAQRFGVSKSLVFAVMKTESSFNPFAVSSAPAYGLMQLVPATGGRDAFRMVEGYDHSPSKEYLFQPAHNIELGTAYLSLLDGRYLGGIRNPTTREYCTISAYNGGAGNVLRMFAKDRKVAVQRINALPPSDVYRRLRQEHPRAETRRYLGKVLAARRDFINI